MEDVMKRVALSAALAACVAFPAFATDLQVEVVSARDSMVVFDMNNDMQVCGDNQINSQVTAVVWDAPAGSDAATILPGKDRISQCGQINSAGDAVGWHDSATSGEDTAVVWYADSGYQAYTEIGMPDEVYSFTQGYAINDDGLVALMAGRNPYVEPGEDPTGLAEDPYLWSAAKGFTPMQNLVPAGESRVFDMNNAGDVVGTSLGDDGSDHAVIWSKNGHVKDLGIPAGERDAIARAINEDGVVIGHDSSFNSDSWVWTKQAGFTKLQDYGWMDRAVGINAHGIIVGTADRSPFDPVPVVWDLDGNIHNIQDLMWTHGYYATDGVSINDNNEIVIYAINFQTGRRQAVVLQLTFVD
jgi:uncharacterized membrane protein